MASAFKDLSDPFHCLKDPVRWQTNELLYAAVSDRRKVSVALVTEHAKLNDWKVSAEACLWFVRFIDILERPLQLCCIPNSGLRERDNFGSKFEL